MQPRMTQTEQERADAAGLRKFPPVGMQDGSGGALVCERKHVGPALLREAVLSLLRLHCLPDPKHPAGWIESIYFDDEAASGYWEKAHGDAWKRKVRIRWYPGTSAPSGGRIDAFLEVKDRICAARAKVHRAFVAEAALLQDAPLGDPRLADLLQELLCAAGFPPRPELRPSLSVRYHRHRFVCPHTQARISLDCDLSSPRSNPGRLPAGPPLRSGRIVCEAKSAQAESWPWSAAICRLGFRRQSFSKYGEFMERYLNRGR